MATRKRKSDSDDHSDSSSQSKRAKTSPVAEAPPSLSSSARVDATSSASAPRLRQKKVPRTSGKVPRASKTVPQPQATTSSAPKEQPAQEGIESDKESTNAAGQASSVSNGNITNTTGATTPPARDQDAGYVDNSSEDDSEDDGNAQNTTQPATATNLGSNDKDWVEIEQVIHLRDNVLPDHFGTQSSTSGKLPWNAVAVEYTRICNKPKLVKYQAVAKRYKENIDEYRRLNPGYPTDGQVAYNGTKARKQAVKSGNAEHQQDESEHDEVDSKGEYIPPTTMTEEEMDETPIFIIKGFIEAWEEWLGLTLVQVNPEVDTSSPTIEDSERAYWAVLELTGRQYGKGTTCMVPANDLLATARLFASGIEKSPELNVELQDHDKTTLLRYISCISGSPALKHSLPEFDFNVRRGRKDGVVELVADVSRIEWTLEDTVSLYELASSFDDRHVCELVLNHWATSQSNNPKIFRSQINSDAINRVFDCDGTGDNACQFWVDSCAAACDPTPPRRSSRKSSSRFQSRPVVNSLFTMEDGYYVKFEDMVSERIGSGCPSVGEIYHQYLTLHAGDYRTPPSEKAKKIDYKSIASRLLLSASRDYPELVDNFLIKHGEPVPFLETGTGEVAGAKHLAKIFKAQHRLAMFPGGQAVNFDYEDVEMTDVESSGDESSEEDSSSDDDSDSDSGSDSDSDSE